MSPFVPLLKEWQKVAYDETKDRGILQRFWANYFNLEKGVYEKLLEEPDVEVKGTVKELAEKYGCRFIDLQAVFNDYFQYRHSSYIAWDRIHPNQIGATVIARAFLEKCGFDYHHRPGEE